MSNQDEARRRVQTLQSRLEEQHASDMRSASRNIVIGLVALVLSAVGMWEMSRYDDQGDAKEL